MDDGFQKEIKELLEQELAMEHICVSEALIQKTMERAAEQTVITAGKDQKGKRVSLKGICAAAAVLVVIGVSIPVLLDRGGADSLYQNNSAPSNEPAMDLYFSGAGKESESRTLDEGAKENNMAPREANKMEESVAGSLDISESLLENGFAENEDADSDGVMKQADIFGEIAVVLHESIEKQEEQYQEILKLIEEACVILSQDGTAREKETKQQYTITYFSDAKEIEISLDVLGVICVYDKANGEAVFYLAEDADEVYSRMEQILK